MPFINIMEDKEPFPNKINIDEHWLILKANKPLK